MLQDRLGVGAPRAVRADDAGTKLARFQIGHTADGFQQLVRRLPGWATQPGP
jgi:hypothetical protein